MPLLATSNGNTPLSTEELADLIPSLATKEELNEWERENILRAKEWATRDRTSPNDMVSDKYIRILHQKMFDQTWKWAGQYRRTEKNIGVPFHEIPERLGVLVGDVRHWIEHSTFSSDEIGVLPLSPRVHSSIPERQRQTCPSHLGYTRNETWSSPIHLGFDRPHPTG
jgi:Fic-DOC domain mobile mystery protein B